jgi:hypothetical protein
MDESLLEYLLKTGNKYQPYFQNEECENCGTGKAEMIVVADETAVPFSLCLKCHKDFSELYAKRNKK